jgi:hypothetical protein
MVTKIYDNIMYDGNTKFYNNLEEVYNDINTVGWSENERRSIRNKITQYNFDNKGCKHIYTGYNVNHDHKNGGCHIIIYDVENIFRNANRDEEIKIHLHNNTPICSDVIGIIRQF